MTLPIHLEELVEWWSVDEPRVGWLYYTKYDIIESFRRKSDLDYIEWIMESADIHGQIDILKWCVLNISSVSFVMNQSRGFRKRKKYLESIGAIFIYLDGCVRININKKGE